MAFQFDVNGSIPGTGAAMLFRMKALLKLVGWTVKASGDGLSSFSSSGDIITSGGTGAGGFANTAAWFRIQQPGANGREFTFQEAGDATTYSCRIKYSGGPGTGFTGGSPSATQTPTASDEQIIFGGGTDASPTYAEFMDVPESNQRFNMIAGDSASNYVFLWWNQVAGGNIRCGMMLDVLQTGTFPGADPDPAVVYINFGSTTIFNSDFTNFGSCKSWFKKNLVGAGFVSVSGMTYCTQSNGHIAFPSGLGQNHITGKDDFAPIVWARDTAETAPTGYKGVSSFLLWNSIQRTYGDTYNVNTTKDYLALSASNSSVYLAIPWNGTDLII